MALVVSLEFLPAHTRSGNGVFARAVVCGLALSMRTLVLTAVPVEDPNEKKTSTATATQVVPVLVPAESWGRLGLPWRLLAQSLIIWHNTDYFSQWAAFAAGCSSAAMMVQIQAFSPTRIIVIDWTGHAGSPRLSCASATRYS